MWTPAGSANEDLGHRSLDSMYTWHQPITSYQEADDANRGPSSRKERFGVGIGECAGTVTHIFNGKVCVREEKQRFDLGTFRKDGCQAIRALFAFWIDWLSNPVI
jgi:hypothetical protein